MAKANKLDLEIVETDPPKGVPAEYLKINPLGKIPSFEGADGYVLTEAIAIAIYSTCNPTVPSRIFYNDEKFYQLQLSLSEDYC